jgi:uncharacterized RDD family membrane protein YckC
MRRRRQQSAGEDGRATIAKMVTTPRSVAPGASTTDTAATPHKGIALRARASAYLIDSVVLLGFIMAFFAMAGLILLLASDLGDEDPSDAAYYAFIGIFIGGTLIGWSVFNLALSLWRGQSPGQYMVGAHVVSEDGGRPTASQIVVRWLSLHPLFFHPLLVPVWGLFAAIAVSVTLSQAVLALTLGLVALCIVAPAVALITSLADPAGRALHDRVVRIIVATIEERA